MKEISEELLRKYEEEGEAHLSRQFQSTPLRKDAFDLSDKEKIARIREYFTGIMETLGLDLEDDSLKGTPQRVAKMYVEELFSGLHPDRKPRLTTFENSYQYGEMLIEKNIRVYSSCEHHFLPIIGTAHVAYISSGRIIGLSKINRIVQYLSRRPQVQERLTVQIGKALQEVLGTEDVAVYMESKHMCVSSRGVQDDSSTTATSHFSGKFKEQAEQEKFLRMVDYKLA